MLYAYYSDHIALPLPDKHAFPRNKYRMARELVAALPASLEIDLRPAPAATDEQLLRVHTTDYLDRVRTDGLSTKEQREIGFPWSEGFVERSLYSTGATLAAAQAVMADHASGRHAWGVHLAGGTHHAFADRGQGFCVFNDAAVAIRELQASGLIATATVFDCDVHQGNGTAAIFANDPSVLTVSLHGARNYPREKQVSDLDVPLPDGCEDEPYLASLDEALAETWRLAPKPDAFFYIAGADPYERDRYGRMKLTRQGLRTRDERVLRQCRERGLPVIGMMGGGYAREVDHVAEIYAGIVESMARVALRRQPAA